jgi:hypothetical protein
MITIYISWNVHCTYKLTSFSIKMRKSRATCAEWAGTVTGPPCFSYRQASSKAAMLWPKVYCEFNDPAQPTQNGPFGFSDKPTMRVRRRRNIRNELVEMATTVVPLAAAMAAAPRARDLGAPDAAPFLGIRLRLCPSPRGVACALRRPSKYKVLYPTGSSLSPLFLVRRACVCLVIW